MAISRAAIIRWPWGFVPPPAASSLLRWAIVWLLATTRWRWAIRAAPANSRRRSAIRVPAHAEPPPWESQLPPIRIRRLWASQPSADSGLPPWDIPPPMGIIPLRWDIPPPMGIIPPRWVKDALPVERAPRRWGFRLARQTSADMAARPWEFRRWPAE